MVQLLILPLLSGFLLVLFLTPLFIPLARKYGIVQQGKEERLQHTPTAGGIPLFLGVLGSLFFTRILFGSSLFPPYLFPLLLTTVLFLLLGLVDDLYPLSPLNKLILQIVLILGWLTVSGVRVLYLTHPLEGVSLEISPWLGMMLALGWILLLVNAWNLVDGMDGLSVALALNALFFMAISSETVTPLQGSLLGACAGFLLYNFPPARIYLGNAGSYALGFLLGAYSVAEHMKAVLSFSFFTVLALFALPLGDLFYAVIRRFFRHRHHPLLARIQEILKRDEEHIHHLFARKLKTSTRALLALFAVASSLGLLGLLLSIVRNPSLALFLTGLLFLSLIGFFGIAHRSFRTREGGSP